MKPTPAEEIKQAAHELIDRLPENITWDELAYAFKQYADIEEGLADADAGRLIPDEKVMEWIESWGTENELEPPTWHEDVVAERESKLESGEANLITLEELAGEIEKALKSPEPEKPFDRDAWLEKTKAMLKSREERFEKEGGISQENAEKRLNKWRTKK